MPRTKPRASATPRACAQVAQRVLREVPGATLARDSAGRVTDIAVDHSEFTHLDAAAIAAAWWPLMQAEGMNATVSSIHVNGWFGSHTKLSAAHWMVRRLYGRELAGEIERWIYVGDSTNDQAMFGAFPLSVGVANLRRFAAELHTWPAYITTGERGAGFAEVAHALLAARARGMTPSRPLLARAGAGAGGRGVAGAGALFLCAAAAADARRPRLELLHRRRHEYGERRAATWSARCWRRGRCAASTHAR